MRDRTSQRDAVQRDVDRIVGKYHDQAAIYAATRVEAAKEAADPRNAEHWTSVAARLNEKEG